LNAADVDKSELLVYMRQHTLAVLSSRSADGAPQGALIGIAVSDSMEVVFDTLSTSRKHGNLARDPRVAVTFAGPDERTLQLRWV
jgi:pyridoxine/pyridoxamine 5'-phosphate oxidase